MSRRNDRQGVASDSKKGISSVGDALLIIVAVIGMIVAMKLFFK